MKAAVHTSYGPPDVVRIAEVEKPAAKDMYTNVIVESLDEAKALGEMVKKVTN